MKIVDTKVISEDNIKWMLKMCDKFEDYIKYTRKNNRNIKSNKIEYFLTLITVNLRKARDVFNKRKVTVKDTNDLIKEMEELVDVNDFEDSNDHRWDNDNVDLDEIIDIKENYASFFDAILLTQFSK